MVPDTDHTVAVERADEDADRAIALARQTPIVSTEAYARMYGRLAEHRDMQFVLSLLMRIRDLTRAREQFKILEHSEEGNATVIRRATHDLLDQGHR